MSSSAVEALVEELIDLQNNSATFREAFRTQQISQLFVDGFKVFVSGISTHKEVDHGTIRMLEKLSHFGLTLSLDPAVAGPQKKEVTTCIDLNIAWYSVKCRSWTPSKEQNM